METLGLHEWIIVVLTILFTISETLPFTQKVKSNGIFQAVVSVIKLLLGKK